MLSKRDWAMALGFGLVILVIRRLSGDPLFGVGAVFGAAWMGPTLMTAQYEAAKKGKEPDNE